MGKRKEAMGPPQLKISKKPWLPFVVTGLVFASLLLPKNLVNADNNQHYLDLSGNFSTISAYGKILFSNFFYFVICYIKKKLGFPN